MPASPEATESHFRGFGPFRNSPSIRLGLLVAFVPVLVAVGRSST